MSLFKPLAIIAILFLALMWWSCASQAMGRYDAICCSNRDCEKISDTAVTIEAGGYRVRYHAKLGLDVDVFVPISEIKYSRDGDYHGCANSVEFLCLYVPTGDS